MVHSNPERESKIRELWQLDHTIDEITILSGIPRSTVGYYVRKLNRQNRRRPTLTDRLDRLASPTKPSSTDGISSSVVNKTFFWTVVLPQMLDLWKARRFEECYYMLRCWELLPKAIRPNVASTEEEAKELVKQVMAVVTNQAILNNQATASKKRDEDVLVMQNLIMQIVGKGHPEILKAVLDMMLKACYPAGGSPSPSRGSPSKSTPEPTAEDGLPPPPLPTIPTEYDTDWADGTNSQKIERRSGK
jgi:hypothetical protein